MRAAAGFLFHLGGIDCAVEIGHGLKNRTRGAVRRHTHLGESRVEFVRLAASRRDFFALNVKSQLWWVMSTLLARQVTAPAATVILLLGR